MKAAFFLSTLLVASATMTRAQLPNPRPSPAGEKWVCVIGGVAKPSRITINSGFTVTQAIEGAGGIEPNNKSSLVRVYSRTTDGVSRIITVDLKAVRKNPALDLTLQSYDIVEVPRKKIRGVVFESSLKPCISQARQ